MKVIDAVWEKRNLGVTCYELHLEKRDGLLQVEEEYSKIQEQQYMVARVPSSRYDLTGFFQKKGYAFIESAITLEHDLKEITVPNRLMRVCGRCGWEKMNREDMDRLSGEVYKNIFSTDRIYIDPAFTMRQAAQRYDFWIKDLIGDGNIPYKVVYEKEAVGFFLNRRLDGNIYDGILAAAYKDFEGSGMGYCIQYAGIKSAMDAGACKYIGHVSGNNLPVLKILLSIGFRMKAMEYIFIKHGKGEMQL